VTYRSSAAAPDPVIEVRRSGPDRVDSADRALVELGLPDGGREHVPVTSNHLSHSLWLGLLSRPFSACSLSGRKKDVDARDKRCHDENKARFD
jgi:hypothetical protein